MTTDEPSEAAKRKACELANAHVATGDGCYWPEQVPSDPPLYALALHLDEVDRVAREVELGVWETGDPDAREKVRSLMLPDPVDPDEELAREIAASFGDKWSWYDLTLADIIKRLREMGKLVKETPDD